MKTARTRLALIGAVLALSIPAAARAALPFLEDDYPRALSQARSRGVPLFVEAWAPW